MAKATPEKSCHVLGGQQTMLATTLGGKQDNNRYEVCPESKDTKVLNMYSIFNLQKRHCE